MPNTCTSYIIDPRPALSLFPFVLCWADDVTVSESHVSSEGFCEICEKFIPLQRSWVRHFFFFNAPTSLESQLSARPRILTERSTYLIHKGTGRGSARHSPDEGGDKERHLRTYSKKANLRALHNDSKLAHNYRYNSIISTFIIIIIIQAGGPLFRNISRETAIDADVKYPLFSLPSTRGARSRSCSGARRNSTSLVLFRTTGIPKCCLQGSNYG